MISLVRRIGGIVLSAGLALTAIAPIASAAAQPAKQATRAGADDSGAYHLEKGPFEVKTTDLLVLHDEARGKDLEVLVRVPSGEAAKGKKLPLVIFSHGMGGSRKAFGALTEHWASWGYVVILPTHEDSVEIMRREGKKPADLLSKGGAARNVNPPERVKDCSFILDSLDLIESKVDGLAKGTIDRDHIAISGHSAGALTAQLAFGMKARTKSSPLEAVTIGDDRFKAAVIVSGQGVSRGWINQDAWEQITRPMMVITGSEDTVSVSKETPETRRHPYEFAKPGDKYLMFIEGATHSSYQGKSDRPLMRAKDPANVEKIGQIVQAGTLAFLDAYIGQGLGRETEARQYLKGDRLTAFSGGILEFKSK